MASPDRLGAAGRFPADGAVDPCDNVSKLDTLSIFVTLAAARRERNDFRYVFRSGGNAGAPGGGRPHRGVGKRKVGARETARPAPADYSGLRGFFRPEPSGTLAGSVDSVTMRLSSSTKMTAGSRVRASSSVMTP